MYRSTRFLLAAALAAMAFTAFAAPPSAAPPPERPATAVSKDVNPIHLVTAATGSGAESALKAFEAQRQSMPAPMRIALCQVRACFECDGLQARTAGPDDEHEGDEPDSSIRSRVLRQIGGGSGDCKLPRIT